MNEIDSAFAIVRRRVWLQVAMARPPKIFKKEKLIAFVTKISDYSEVKGPNRQIIEFWPQIRVQIRSRPNWATPFGPLK